MGGCCNNFPINGSYVPLNKRLIEYGKDSYVHNPELLEKFSYTHMWIFTFIDSKDYCEECQVKFSIMSNWFNKYNLLNDPKKNVKWIVDDEIENNLIFKDLDIKKTPFHLFCDSNGKIIDIIYGFADDEWLEKHILPLIRTEII